MKRAVAFVLVALGLGLARVSVALLSFPRVADTLIHAALRLLVQARALCPPRRLS